MSRLSIGTDPEQHRQIKALATFAGLSIKDYILIKTLAPTSAPTDSTDRLLSSPENAALLCAAIAAPSSEHLTFETLIDLERALGI